MVVNGNYFGLSPKSFNTSSYHCGSCGATFGSNDALVLFCPNCAEASTKEKTKVEAKVPDDTYRLTQCTTCGSEIYSDLEPETIASHTGSLHCPECGDKLSLPSGDQIEEPVKVEPVQDPPPEVVELSEEIPQILSATIVDKDSVKMDLWHSENGNMIRNVIISGVPVARIFLEDQEDPKRTGEIFGEDYYVDTLASEMLTSPVGEVLKSARARILSDMVEDKTQITKKEMDETVKEQVEAFRNKFKETFLMVLQGVNKNMFPDVQNTLKEALWTEMASVGIEEPQKVIEPVFDDKAEPFLENVFDKTLDYMNKGDDVLKEISKVVSSSEAISVEEGADKNFSRRLADSSIPVAITQSIGKVSDLRSRIGLRRQ